MKPVPISEESYEESKTYLAERLGITVKEFEARINDVDLEKILAEKLVSLESAISSLKPGDFIKVCYGEPQDDRITGEYLSHNVSSKTLTLKVSLDDLFLSRKKVIAYSTNKTPDKSHVPNLGLLERIDGKGTKTLYALFTEEESETPVDDEAAEKILKEKLSDLEKTLSELRQGDVVRISGYPIMSQRSMEKTVSGVYTGYDGDAKTLTVVSKTPFGVVEKENTISYGLDSLPVKKLVRKLPKGTEVLFDF